MSRPKIFVNPKFHQTSSTQVHINPNFVPRASCETIVHVNPLFLQLSQPVPVLEEPRVKVSTTPPQPLIRKTRHKLLRIKTTPNVVPPSSVVKSVTRPQMIKVGRNKLIKANIFAGMSRTAASLVTKPSKKSVGNQYKIDNRVVSRDVKPLKVPQSRHKTLELKRINGQVYKTSKNRLERQSSSNVTSLHASNKQSDRLISLNGSKFILKESGKRLIPIKTGSSGASTSKSTLEIAGIRFIQLMDGTYVRHHNQTAVVRQHLTTSKYKSIKILAQKMRKCNIPCPVFRRIGKCLAFTRGRCPKVHDVKYVDICSAALRKGGCTKTGCLMSHDLSLSKMPACKYFLKGCCVNDDCPFLHHKLNENVALCPEFLKGFCPKADQCDKRHEHPETNKKLTRIKRKTIQKHQKPKLETLSEETTTNRRYFISDDTGSGKEISDQNFTGVSSDESRPPIGTLPSFIPI